MVLMEFQMNNKKYSSVEEMLDELDPEFADEFRLMMARPSVRFRRWATIRMLLFRIWYDKTICRVIGHKYDSIERKCKRCYEQTINSRVD